MTTNPYRIAFWFMLVVAAALTIGWGVADREHAQDLALVKAQAQDQARVARTEAREGEAQAFKMGIIKCSNEDVAFFEAHAANMKNKMNTTNNPLKYFMFKYMYTTMKTWQYDWAYDDSILSEMVGEYMGTGSI